MLTSAYYLLKVVICSCILYGYYQLALRNKVFHRWNRFYLLAAVVLSLAAPLIKINIWQKAGEPKTQMIQVLQTVSTGDEFVFDFGKAKGNSQINASYISLCIYIIISLLLFAFLVQTLFKIYSLKQNNKQTHLY